MIRALLAALVVAVALPAAALEVGPSPRWGSFELSLGAYKPNVDAEFGGAAQPWQTAFGGGRGLIFRADAAISLLKQYGTLDLGLGAGYFSKSGHGQNLDGSTSVDATTFWMIPIRLSLTYRFDVLVERYNIPFTPYARVSLDRYQWWVQNGAGNTANANGRNGSGATNGYSLSGGLAFLLDWLDPTLAREMDRDTGINHTYIFVDFTKSYVKDFNSATSWDLSDEKVSISGGLLFVF